MIKYYLHDYEYLELCRCFMNLYDVNRDGNFAVYLENYLAFAILTPFCQEQDDFARRISVDPNLEKTEELKTFKSILTDYLKNELISYHFIIKFTFFNPCVIQMDEIHFKLQRGSEEARVFLPRESVDGSARPSRRAQHQSGRPALLRRHHLPPGSAPRAAEGQDRGIRLQAGRRSRHHR